MCLRVDLYLYVSIRQFLTFHTNEYNIKVLIASEFLIPLCIYLHLFIPEPPSHFFPHLKGEETLVLISLPQLGHTGTLSQEKSREKNRGQVVFQKDETKSDIQDR